jgi:hypothetical protein
MPNESMKNDRIPPPAEGEACTVRVRFVDERGKRLASAVDCSSWFHYVGRRGGPTVSGVEDYPDWYSVFANGQVTCRPKPADLELACGRRVALPEIRFLSVPNAYCCLDFPTQSCQPSGLSYKAEVLRKPPGSAAVHEPFEGLVIWARSAGGACGIPTEYKTTTDCCGKGYIPAQPGLWRITAECPPGYEFHECEGEHHYQVCSHKPLEVEFCLKLVETTVRVVLSDEHSKQLEDYEVSLCAPPAPGERVNTEKKQRTSKDGVAILESVPGSRQKVTVRDKDGLPVALDRDTIEVRPGPNLLVATVLKPVMPGQLTVQAQLRTVSGRNLTGTAAFIQQLPGGAERLLREAPIGSDGSIKFYVPGVTQSAAEYLRDKAIRVGGNVIPCASAVSEPAQVLQAGTPTALAARAMPAPVYR